ncbi:MAG: DUF433 domain-containing protein [Planctomycetes bacterium]|nr:DUF433 domain-containing protein [Planctomycetota bacterium]
MQLEDYFEFETFETQFGLIERVRIKGHRIGIEHVVGYFKEGFSPETIVRDVYPSLNLEKVYATLLYYEANKEKVEEYIRRGDEIGDKFYEESLKQPETDALRRLKALKAARRQTAVPPAQSTTSSPTEPSVP